MRAINIENINPNYEVEIMEYVCDTCESFKDGFFAATEAEAYGYFIENELEAKLQEKGMEDLLSYLDVDSYVRENFYCLYGLIDIPAELGGGVVYYELESDF